MRTEIGTKIRICALIVLASVHRLVYSAVRPAMHGVPCPQNCICTGWTSKVCSNIAEPNKVFAQLDEQQPILLNLSLTGSAISDLTHLPSMKRLIFLNLSNNHISVFNTPRSCKFPNVRQLILRHNHFTVLERDAFIMFPAVEILDLSYNSISQVDWEAFRLFRLKQLIIANNNLTIINEHMLRFTPSLQYLDLSYNNLHIIQSSNFFAAQKLKEINLSHNKIKTFNYDSFSPLYQLEVLDLSYNDLETIPAIDLRQLVGLRTLRMGANHFKRIASSELIHPMLHELDLSYSSKLRVVEQFAFSSMPNLHTVNLNNSQSLIYVSPHAFINNTMLHSVDLSYCALEVLSDGLLSAVSRGSFDHNPLQCGCIAKSIKQHITRLRDLEQATCSTVNGGIKSISTHATWQLEECRPEPVLPFGDFLEATIGEQYSIYCASRQPSDSVIWRFPNRTDIPAQVYTPMQIDPISAHSLFTDSYHRFSLRQFNTDQKTMRPLLPRVRATNEQIWLDVVLAEDEGEYRCTVKRAQRSVYRTIRLSIKEPAITLYTLEVGSHYVTLAWNGSLRIHSKERVQFFVAVRDVHGVTSRTVQLSLHNPWHSYNIMRLKAGQNYTFCLCYTLANDLEENTYGKLIYETCLEQRTAPNLSFIESISLSTLIILAAVLLLLCSLAFFRVLYARFHIWQQQKHRSRMNQSISGQSFLSSTSNGADSAAITYENQLQLSISQSSSLNQCSVASASRSFASDAASRNRFSGGRLLAEDLAL